MAKDLQKSSKSMLRQGNAALIVATFLLLGMPVVGQEAGEPVDLFDDNSGDVSVTLAGVAVPHADRFGSMDLVSASIEETPQALLVTLGVADLDTSDDVILLEQGTLYLEFHIGLAAYRVAFFPPTFATLMVHDATLDRWVQIVSFQATADIANGLMTATVPRTHLQDENGQAIHPELEITDFIARSYGAFNEARFNFGDTSNEFPYLVSDVMPNNDEPEGVYVPVFGIQQQGHIRLGSEVPVRASNGDDTTYVYEIEVHNLLGEDDQVSLSVQGAPDGWDIRIPADEVRLEANKSLKLPVLVSTPFAHAHGSFQSFIVEAYSANDPNTIGRVELGVRYTAIPQPAGHHNQLWLHSRAPPVNQFSVINDLLGGGPQAYFNAAEDEDENDAGLDVPAYACGSSQNLNPDRPFETRFCWRIYLEPTLQMGLDFDLNGTGMLEVPINSVVPMTDAIVSGRLSYLRSQPNSNNNFQGFQDTRIVTLGQLLPSEPASTGANSGSVFESIFVPDAGADLIEFDPNGASMWIDLQVSINRPPTFFEGATAPVLAPGGNMVLPLYEYQDPVDDLFHTLTDVDIEMEQAQEAYVNPAESVLFEMRIVNSGVVNDQFELSLEGSNVEWAEILGDQKISVKSGSNRLIVVAVSAPETAEHGDQVDIILEARSTKDPDARALVRLLAEVDTARDHPDQSEMLFDKEEELTTKTVPIGAWPMFVALGAALIVRRRLQE